MFRDFSMNTKKKKKKTFEFLSIIKRDNTDNNLSIDLEFYRRPRNHFSTFEIDG